MPTDMKVTPLTDAEAHELVAAWDEWWRKEHPDDFHPYSELWRRAKEAKEHPERMIPHEEAMASIREGRPARSIEQLEAEKKYSLTHCWACGAEHYHRLNCPFGYGNLVTFEQHLKPDGT